MKGVAGFFVYVAIGKEVEVSTLKIMGSQARLSQLLSPWKIQVRGGHTVLSFETNQRSGRMARDVFNSLVTIQKYTAIDTTVPEAPKRIGSLPTQANVDVVLIPQLAGG